MGAGLAGLRCALELTSRRRGVLLLEGGRVVGGRTSSWDEDGMLVESGLHRVRGFYAAFPDLLRKAGLNIDDIVCGEDEIELCRTGAAAVCLARPPCTIRLGP